LWIRVSRSGQVKKLAINHNGSDPRRQKETEGASFDSAELLHSGRWCAKLGVALIIFGTLAISTAFMKGINSVVLIGWLMLVSALTEAVHAFYLWKSGAFFFHLVPAIAGVPIGLLMLTHTSAGAVAWMLVFASSFTVIGLFRVIAAFRYRFPGWTWAAIDAIATLLLTALFWTTSPLLTPWYFGLAVGTSLILRGLSSIMFGRGLRALRTRDHPLATIRAKQTEPFQNRSQQVHSNRSSN
jgi:uncharacterized membrane protein HdeD (DUF308 family)